MLAAGDYVRDHRMKVCGIPAVIESQLSVTFPAAAPEVHGDRVPSSTIEGLDHTEHVRAGGIAFKTVQEDRDSIEAGSGQIEIQKISIRRVDAFPLVRYPLDPAEHAGKYGLDVSIGKKDRRAV